MSNFQYYKLSIKLTSEQLGTCTEASIYAEHILQKAKKMIAEANRLSKKVTKMYEKYVGSEITEEKEVKELQGVLRRYRESLGKTDELPSTIEELIEYSVGLDEEYGKMIKDMKEIKPTCFMRDKRGMPVLSSHMILGNLKENLKIITNNTTMPKDKKPVKSKVAVGEMLALDVKWVEPFMYPDKDIARNSIKLPMIDERPIRFERKGKTETAIARSEYLHIGTTYSVHLRVRKDSPINNNDAKLLHKLFDYGKNNGIGQWRGSGGKGQYIYKLEPLKESPIKVEDGWM